MRMSHFKRRIMMTLIMYKALEMIVQYVLNSGI